MLRIDGSVIGIGVIDLLDRLYYSHAEHVIQICKEMNSGLVNDEDIETVAQTFNPVEYRYKKPALRAMSSVGKKYSEWKFIDGSVLWRVDCREWTADFWGHDLTGAEKELRLYWHAKNDIDHLKF